MAEFGINLAKIVGFEAGRTRKGEAYLKAHIECGKKAKGEPRIFYKFLFQPKEKTEENMQEYKKEIYKLLTYVVGEQRAKAGIAKYYQKGQSIDHFLHGAQKTFSGSKPIDLFLHYEAQPREGATRTYLTVGDSVGAWWDKPRGINWKPQVHDDGLVFVNWSTGQVHPTISRPMWWVKKGYCEPRGVQIKEGESK